MNYQSHTNKRGSSAKTVVIVLLVSLVLFMATFGLGMLQRTAARSTGVVASIGNFFSTLSADKQLVIDENTQLRAILEERTTAQALSLIQSQELSRLVRENFSVDTSVTVASVVSRPPISPYDTYLVDIGDNTEVAEHQLVVSDNRYAVGDVYRVSGEIAQVQLFSHPGRESVVSVNGELYQAVGSGGGIITVRLPRNYEDTEPVVVTLPGITQYVLGVIEHTQFDPQDSFVEGIIVMPKNIYTQEIVTISRQLWRNPLDLVETLYETKDADNSNTPTS